LKSKLIKRHAKMLFDFERTLPLLKAIKKIVKKGDVVVDVGCGLGILTFAACYSGAKRVYAIDVDTESLEFAKRHAKKFKLDKKIIWLADHSYNVDLIEKADVLIQETVGASAFDENFLPSLVDARNRFLKRGGKIIPEEVSLYGAPCGNKGKLLAPPKRLAHILTQSITKKELKINATWRLKEKAKIKGILLWPHVVWTKGCITDCSPSSKPTHWGQTLLPLGTRYQAVPHGTRYHTVTTVKFSLKITPHPKNPLYNSQIEWQIASPYEGK